MSERGRPARDEAHGPSPDNTSPRVAELVREIAGSSASDPRTNDLVTQASVAVEELVVADEELRAQAEELAASRDAVDEERERYADLFEMMPDAVIETDNHGKILEANDAAGRCGPPSCPSSFS